MEQFYNETDMAISPGETPTLNPSQIEAEELDQEIGSRNVSRPSTYRQLSLLLSCVTLLKNNLVFIECFFNHGGIYFLIPYFVVLFVLGIPMAVFELSLAQFSSIPLYGMFVRMAPLLGGIPYLILSLRIVYTVFIAFEPRFLLYMYKSLATVITENIDWINCENYKGVRCFDPTLSCGINEFQLNGKCVKDIHITKLARQQDYGLSTYFSFREQRLVSLIPAQIYKEIKSLDIMDNVLAALVFLLITGFIAYKGHRFFASVAGCFVFLPILGMIPTIIVIYYDVTSRKKHFFYKIVNNNDIRKIFRLESWLNAARVSVKTVYIADGTLMTLGSMAGFRHNFIKDAILLAASGSAYRLLLCFGILPIIYIGNDILYPFAKTVYAEGDLVQFHAIDIFFSALPSYSVSGVSSTAVFFIFAVLYGTINFAFIAYQVITFEMLMHWVHHAFPRVLYLKNKETKICIIMATVIVLITLFSLNLPMKLRYVGYKKESEIDEYIVGLVSTTVLIELVSVTIIYGNKRLLINYLTMLKHHPGTYKLVEKLRYFLFFMWTIVLPVSCLLSIASVIIKKYQIYQMPVFTYALVSCLPVMFFMRKLAIFVVKKEPCKRNRAR
ncbi:unnamed protein product [Caenorhabditis sp. 36 PRJEB53466]|nr:unnamed protein product [Caenorhabditis sp. 36 PRJEB53466]